MDGSPPRLSSAISAARKQAGGGAHREMYIAGQVSTRKVKAISEELYRNSQCQVQRELTISGF